MRLSGATHLFLSVSTLAWAATASANGLGNGTAPEVPWLRIVISLLFCLALAAAAIVAIKRSRIGIGGFLKSGRKLRQPEIHVVETRRIAPHASVCLVEFDGRHLLLGVSAQGVAVIAERAASDLSEEQTAGAD